MDYANYANKELTEAFIKKEILEAGTTLLVSNAVDQAGRIDFDKLSSILNAYKDALNDIDRDIDYWKKQVYTNGEEAKTNG